MNFLSSLHYIGHLYDVDIWTLNSSLCRYVGRLSVKSMSKPVEILTKLNEMAGYSADQEIELYEVCSH